MPDVILYTVLFQVLICKSVCLLCLLCMCYLYDSVINMYYGVVLFSRLWVLHMPNHFSRV